MCRDMLSRAVTFRMEETGDSPEMDADHLVIVPYSQGELVSLDPCPIGKHGMSFTTPRLGKEH